MVFICMLFFSSCLSFVSDIATRVWDNWYSTADLQLRSSVFLFCSYVSAPPPFFFTFLGRIQDLFSYLFLDLFFLYFFPELKTKRFTFCQAAPWGSRAQFFSAEWIVPFPRVTVKRPSLWLYVISQNARLHGPPGSVTRNTRDILANPRPFLFIPIQIE